MKRLPGVNPQHLLQAPARENIGHVMGHHKCKYHNVRLFSYAPTLRITSIKFAE